MLPHSLPPRAMLYICSVPVAPIRSSPDKFAKRQTEILLGQSFHVIREDKYFYYGDSRSPINDTVDYQGYVSKSHLALKTEDPTHIVTGLRAPLFSSADIKAPLKNRQLLRGGRITAKKTLADFVKIGRQTFIHKHHIRRLDVDPIETDFVTIAEQYLGLPYIWGGVSANGLDCSGLVQSALRAVGQDSPRDSGPQESVLGDNRPLDITKLKRGDLIFWRGHVGIMQNRYHLIHANAHHMCVASEAVETAVRRIAAAGLEITSVKRF